MEKWETTWLWFYYFFYSKNNKYGEWHEVKHIKNINGDNEYNIIQIYIDSMELENLKNILWYKKEIGIENGYFV